MDRITHQSPRQRGYGSTSSPRNDSLKHTWKHKKGREELNQEAKRTGSCRPSGQEGRTVRTGLADRPACCRGPSAPTLRTVRPCASDRPIKHTEPTEATREKRTVRREHADCSPGTRGPPACCGPSETSSNQNSKSRRIETKGEQEHEEHLMNSCGADRPPGRRGPSARHGQSRKTARPRRSTPPNHHWISQTVEAVETRVWGLEKRHTRML
jgi:hypothetical protein